MRRLLLLPLFAGALALALPTLGRQLAEGCAVRFAQQESGVLTTSEGEVHFTLYWPSAASHTRTLVILAADARAAHPRPLRLLARAAAASGFAAVYLEPSEAPGEAAARLKALLERHAEALGLDAASVWTWVEGRHLAAPTTPRCHQRSPLADAYDWLRQGLRVPSALARTVLALTSRSECSLARHL